MPKVADACDFCNSKKFLKRDDDSVEVVQKRLVSYYKQTEPLINYYNNIGLLEEIDASLPVHILEKKLSSIIEDKQIKQ
jgi:adenylate kinase